MTWTSYSQPINRGTELPKLLRTANVTAELLVCDEAHRTAGIREIKAKSRKETVRNFTVCHRSKEMPARTRLYMTATPRTFSIGEGSDEVAKKWEVHTMNDEATFGVESYRLTYKEAVTKGYLTDYRIIAIAAPENAVEIGNRMAERTRESTNDDKGQDGKRFTTSLAVRKLVYGLALAGAVPNPDDEAIHLSNPFEHRVRQSNSTLEGHGERTWTTRMCANGYQTPRKKQPGRI